MRSLKETIAALIITTSAFSTNTVCSAPMHLTPVYPAEQTKATSRVEYRLNNAHRHITNYAANKSATNPVPEFNMPCSAAPEADEQKKSTTNVPLPPPENFPEHQKFVIDTLRSYNKEMCLDFCVMGDVWYPEAKQYGDVEIHIHLNGRHIMRVYDFSDINDSIVLPKAGTCLKRFESKDAFSDDSAYTKYLEEFLKQDISALRKEIVSLRVTEHLQDLKEKKIIDNFYPLELCAENSGKPYVHVDFAVELPLINPYTKKPLQEYLEGKIKSYIFIDIDNQRSEEEVKELQFLNKIGLPVVFLSKGFGDTEKRNIEKAIERAVYLIDPDKAKFVPSNKK